MIRLGLFFVMIGLSFPEFARSMKELYNYSMSYTLGRTAGSTVLLTHSMEADSGIPNQEPRKYTYDVDKETHRIITSVFRRRV